MRLSSDQIRDGVSLDRQKSWSYERFATTVNYNSSLPSMVGPCVQACAIDSKSSKIDASHLRSIKSGFKLHHRCSEIGRYFQRKDFVYATRVL